MRETGRQKIDIDEVEKQIRLLEMMSLHAENGPFPFRAICPIRASCSSALGLSRLFFALIAFLIWPLDLLPHHLAEEAVHHGSIRCCKNLEAVKLL